MEKAAGAKKAAGEASTEKRTKARRQKIEKRKTLLSFRPGERAPFALLHFIRSLSMLERSAFSEAVGGSKVAMTFGKRARGEKERESFCCFGAHPIISKNCRCVLLFSLRLSTASSSVSFPFFPSIQERVPEHGRRGRTSDPTSASSRGFESRPAQNKQEQEKKKSERGRGRGPDRKGGVIFHRYSFFLLFSIEPCIELLASPPLPSLSAYGAATAALSLASRCALGAGAPPGRGSPRARVASAAATPGRCSGVRCRVGLEQFFFFWGAVVIFVF